MFRSLFYIGMISVCLLGCSKHEWEQADAPGNAARDDGKAYLTISLSLPRASETRSQTDQQGGTGATGGTEEGSNVECKVTNAWVILGELAEGQQDPIQISQRYFIEEFQYAGNPAQWSTTIPCPPGHYRIAIIVNPGNAITFNNLTHWDKLARYVARYSHYTDLAKSWTANQFLMTNAYRGRMDDNDVQLVAGEHTYKDLYVQRTCARFDYKATQPGNRYKLEFPLNGTSQKQLVDLQLTDMGLVNISNNFNLFKMTVPDIQPGRVPNFYEYETNDNYVYDSDWKEKWILQMPSSHHAQLRELFFFPSEKETADSTLPVPDSFSYIPLPTALNPYYTPLTYASENTLPGIQAQINKLSTGVVFKGKFTLPGTSPINTIYYRSLSRGNEIYTSLNALKQVLIQEGYPPLPSNPTDADWAQLGIQKYNRQSDGSFPVYYTYWNRHHDNLNPQEMGIMEFAVVRNNVYKLAVTSISSLGLPRDPNDPQNPWKPDGNTPDEQLPQMDVTVEVCEWVERELVHEI